MENPQWTSKFIFPSEGQSTISVEDWVISDLSRRLFYPTTLSDQDIENPTIDNNTELPSSPQIRRQRVSLGERQNLLARRNLLFEATIGRRCMGSSNEICDVVYAPTKSTIINTGECLLFLSLVPLQRKIKFDY